MKTTGLSAIPRVFLSFSMEHKPLVESFRDQARDSGSGLLFRDYSIKEPVEGAWRMHAERMIRESSVTICLVGDSTWRSEPVNWEVRKRAPNSASGSWQCIARQCCADASGARGGRSNAHAMERRGNREQAAQVNDSPSVDEVARELFGGREPATTDSDALLAQYSLFVRTSEALAARRRSSAAAGLLLRDGNNLESLALICLSLGGCVLCFIWRRLMSSFRQLSRGKFEVIHALERHLPARLFTAEWIALGRGEDPQRYRPFIKTEETPPLVFAGLHALFICADVYLLVT